MKTPLDWTPKAPNRIGTSSLPGPHCKEALAYLRQMERDLPTAHALPGWLLEPSNAKELDAWCRREEESRQRLTEALYEWMNTGTWPASLDPTDMHILRIRITAARECGEATARLIDPRFRAREVANRLLVDAWKSHLRDQYREILHRHMHRILGTLSRSACQQVSNTGNEEKAEQDASGNRR